MVYLSKTHRQLTEKYGAEFTGSFGGGGLKAREQQDALAQKRKELEMAKEINPPVPRAMTELEAASDPAGQKSLEYLYGLKNKGKSAEQELRINKMILETKKLMNELGGENPVSTTDAANLGVPVGTPEKDTKGMYAVSPMNRATLAQFKTARDIISQIEGYSKKVNTVPQEEWARNMAEGVVKKGKSLVKSDKDVYMLQNLGLKLSKIIRSLGEKGALAEGDVARGEASSPGTTDPIELAEQKIADLYEIIDKGMENLSSGLTQPITSGNGEKDMSKMSDAEVKARAIKAMQKQGK